MTELRALSEAATPGPWNVDRTEFGGLWVNAGSADEPHAVLMGMSGEDAAFIVALVNAYRAGRDAGDAERLAAALLDIAENFNHTPERHDYQSENAVPFQRYGWCGPCRARAALDVEAGGEE